MSTALCSIDTGSVQGSEVSSVQQLSTSIAGTPNLSSMLYFASIVIMIYHGRMILLRACLGSWRVGSPEVEFRVTFGWSLLTTYIWAGVQYVQFSTPQAALYLYYVIREREFMAFCVRSALLLLLLVLLCKVVEEAKILHCKLVH